MADYGCAPQEKGGNKVESTHSKTGLKEIVVQGVKNLLAAGYCFHRASRQENWKHHQTRMKALRQQRQTRTVNSYLHRALHIYAKQYSEQSIIIHRPMAQAGNQRKARTASFRLVMNLPHPKRPKRAK